MSELRLTEAERAAADSVLGWATSYQVIRQRPGRKLLRVITPQAEEQYYTLVSRPESCLVFHEPVFFVVTVQAAKGECRAGHQVGDRWQFNWCTPAGLCGSAYHAMYPVLHGLMLTSGRYQGPAAEKKLVSCPDESWLTFRIERRRWTPEMWNADQNRPEKPAERGERDVVSEHPPCFVNPEQASKFAQMEGLETTVLTGLHSERMMMALNATLPGHTVPVHTHPHEQIGMVLRGRGILRIGDDKQKVGPGDFYCIPGGVPHGDTCLGDEAFVMLDIFYPVREDFRDQLEKG